MDQNFTCLVICFLTWFSLQCRLMPPSEPMPLRDGIDDNPGCQYQADESVTRYVNVE